MYRCQKWTSALLLAVLLAMQATTSKAETRIGVATSIRPNAEGGIGANLQKLSPGSELYANETVRTGNLGQADLVFIDKTNLTVGPGSEVLLDKFVYDPTGSSGLVVIKATRGALRFVTGTQDHRAYQLGTPYGTLGVRGTVVELVIQSKEELKKKKKPGRAECGALVKVVEGKATFQTEQGETRDVNQGQTLCVDEVGLVSTTGGGGSAPPAATPPSSGGGNGCIPGPSTPCP